MGSGCAGSVSAQPPAPVEPPPAEVDEAVQPVVMGAESGLEVRVWRVNADESALAGVISEVAEPAPALDAATEDRLRASGLRLVKVRAHAILRLRAMLRVSGRVDRRWLGQPTEWVEAARGSEFRSERVLMLEGERARIGAGALRLLVRAWTGPSPAGPALRLNMAVQNLEPRRADPGDPLLLAPGGPPPARQGLVFPSTVVDTILEEPNVYLLIPVDPASARQSGASPDQQHEAIEPAGPAPPPLRTVGEALLLRRSPITRGEEMRAVVLLIPRLPESYRLLP